MERMQKRAERFGTVVAPVLTAVEEDQKKEKRRERFGMTTTELPVEVKCALVCERVCVMVSVASSGSEAQEAGAFWCQLANEFSCALHPLSPWLPLLPL